MEGMEKLEPASIAAEMYSGAAPPESSLPIPQHWTIAQPWEEMHENLSLHEL